MSTLSTNLHAELQAVTFPLRRRTRFRLHALANDALEKLGRPPQFLESYAEQWRRILGKSEALLSELPAGGTPRVLFGSMFGAETSTRAVDSIVAMALKLRGVDVKFLACDLALPACEWNPLGNFEPPPPLEHGPQRWHFGNRHECRTCMVKLSESHDVTGLERVSLDSFTRPGDLAEARAVADHIPLSEIRGYVKDSVHVGDYAYASLLRGTMRGVPLEDERTLWLARRYLMSALMLLAAGKRLFDAVQPERFVTADGVYMTGGVLADLARQRGIHPVIHGIPYRKGTAWFSHHESYHRALINVKNERWQHFEMSPARTEVADNYLKSKHFVARDYTSYHVDAIQDEEAIRRELGLDERPIVTAYTNVLWDAQLYYKFNVFPNMLVWLFDTIRFFGSRPDLQLVLRLHPGEGPGGLPTNQPILPEVLREFPTLPDNVKLVRPESKVSSYVLGTMSRAALVYGARMGVELVMLGTPVVVAGEAFMRGKGFTIDPASREDYFDVLSRSASLESPSLEARAIARRWYYYYFFRMMMDFPFYVTDRIGPLTPTRLTFDSLEDLRPGRSPVLDLICQGILDGKTPFERDEFDTAAPVQAPSERTAERL